MSLCRGVGLVLTLVLALLSGCATTGKAPVSAAQRVDPWENWNRKVYAFNDALDEAVLQPVATTYTKVVPQPVRRGFSNFVGNFGDMWSGLNNLLQGKVADGLSDFVRVGTNTLFGLGGFLDVAGELGIDRHNEDLGQTLGVWGMAPGPYVVWPLLGPSTLRDSLALPVDRSISPALAIHNEAAKYTVTGLQLVNERAGLLAATGMLGDIALDKYSFVRDAYLQRRRSLVFDGEVPEDKEDRQDEGAEPTGDDRPPVPVPAPAASAASGAS